MTVCAPQRKNSASSYCPPRNSGRDPGRTKYPRRTTAAESDDYFLSDLNLRDPNLSSESGGKIDIIDFKWTSDRLLGRNDRDSRKTIFSKFGEDCQSQFGPTLSDRYS